MLFSLFHPEYIAHQLPGAHEVLSENDCGYMEFHTLKKVALATATIILHDFHCSIENILWQSFCEHTNYTMTEFQWCLQAQKGWGTISSIMEEEEGVCLYFLYVFPLDIIFSKLKSPRLLTLSLEDMCSKLFELHPREHDVL